MPERFDREADARRLEDAISRGEHDARRGEHLLLGLLRSSVAAP